jgi:hypothetical protein
MFIFLDRRRIGALIAIAVAGRLAAFWVASCAITGAFAQSPLTPSPAFVSVPGPAWTVVTLPDQKPPVTHYQSDASQGRAAVRMEAHASYGPLAMNLSPAKAIVRVQWEWRVAEQGPAINLRSKAGDDTPAKVCVGLDWPDERVPFLERQLLRLSRKRMDMALPGATLCWVWGGKELPGEVIENPYSRRVRYIVLRNATHTGGGWFAEQRNLPTDLRLAFGDEWPSGAGLPLVTAITLAADADNTASHSLAWVGRLAYE